MAIAPIMDTEFAIQAACDMLQQGHADQALLLCDANATSTGNMSIEQGARWDLVRSWALADLDQLEAALASVEMALRKDPGNVHAHLQHAKLLTLLNQLDLSLLALQRGLALSPNLPTLHLDLGVSMHRRGHYREAWHHYQAALRAGLKPALQFAPMFIQAADFSGDAAAVEHFTETFYETPDWVTTPYQLWLEGFRAFKHGEFARAWELYDLRHNSPGIAQSHAFPFPRWEGVYRQGETLLVHGEQGLGDEIMFAGSLPHLLAQTDAAGMRVILAVKPGLCHLFANNFPQCLVVAHHHDKGLLAQWPSNIRVNAHIPLANLPQFFLTSLDDFERNAHPYLMAEPTSIAKFDGLLNLFIPQRRDKLLVGLVWGCAQGKTRELDARAIPAEQLVSLGGIDGIQFISLHNQDHAGEASNAPTLNILDLGLWQQNFSDTAGLIHHMDLVIGVDTATSHLAGAMGKRVLQPLLQYADWRRETPGDQCIWYRDTTYFRQTTMFSWFDVLAKLRVQLEQAVHSFRSSSTSLL